MDILISQLAKTGRMRAVLVLTCIFLSFVNAELVRQGFARVATFPPDVRFQQTYLELEREARAAGRGLWGEAVAPLPTALLPEIVEGETADCTCTNNQYNCPNFATHAAAQACYNFCWQQTGRDVHGLDGDNDGLACESLPQEPG